jgi:hypothetical protein
MGTRRTWLLAVLVVVLSAVFAAGAQAHTVTATATCNSVTFHWTAFASSGNGNGGRNTPDWRIVFTRNASAAAPAATSLSGRVSFTGSSYSLTVTVPTGNGVAAASSWWTPAQTRDGHSASWSKNLAIGNCPPPPPPIAPPPPAAPPTPPSAASLAHPAIATTASAGVALGAAIHDTAVLSGGSSPTGSITFNLYSASDTACSTVLSSSTVPVSGAGSYDSPPVTPSAAGAYQWVATYGGDAHNTSVSGACDDAAEQATVAVTVVEASCVASPVVLHGVSARVHKRLTLYVTALGAKSVTFYLDGRKLATVTTSSKHRYQVTVDARRLRYGAHTVGARVTTRGASCARAAAAGTFVRVRTPTIVPKFTG